MQTQVKLCRRLMAAVIGVEVSDTPDLKLMRRKGEKIRTAKDRVNLNASTNLG